MFGSLVSHNEDLSKLIDNGYAVGFEPGYLIIRDIPYLNQDKELKIGAIVSIMVPIDETHVRQHDHQIYFCGSHPHQIDGTPIKNLGGGPADVPLGSKDILIERSFSNKPANDYKDFFEKIENYVTIISGPAMSLYDVTPLTSRVITEIPSSVFKFQDALTVRAEIGDLNQAFKNDVVVVIGLGGTGSYLLDLIVKTPVKEIRGFDKDFFYVHNAFRSPGRLQTHELGKHKAAVYQWRYNRFHHNLFVHPKNIDSGSVEDLKGVTFAFVCVDKGEARKEIFDLLFKLNIPFIDVGMGLDRKRGPISGGLRTTFYNVGTADALLPKRLAPMTDDKDDVYRKNIQIAELNALNACIAMIKFKQLRGFYLDEEKYYHLLMSINDFSFGNL